MNRKHTVSLYLDIFNKLKKINPAIEFSSDFIIGYPGESEEDFQSTVDLINTYKVSKKLMPLVHLPVQSGSDRILRLMNRKHKIDHYLRVYDELKKK